MDLSSDELKVHIPYYLTENQKSGLSKAFLDFSNEKEVDFYINGYEKEKLQGDGWSKLKILRFSDGERANIKGIILSNTCDISPENQRSFPTKITFAPLVKLSNYTQLLYSSKLSKQQVSDKVEMIKKQKVTSIFFLPSSKNIDDDYIAILDDIHTVPSSATTDSEKIFTLSMFGFYLFVFKLSIHFCRFHEEVQR
jgi:hypothetical protein